MNLKVQLAIGLMLVLSACGGAPAAPTAVPPTPALPPVATATIAPTNAPVPPPTSAPTIAPTVTVAPTVAPTKPPIAAATPAAPQGGLDAMTPIGQIVREFRDNKAAATAKYNGKSLFVRGIVNRINEFAGSYNFYLLDLVEKEGLVVWLATGVNAKQVTIGQQVIVKCVVRGTESVFQECQILT